MDMRLYSDAQLLGETDRLARLIDSHLAAFEALLEERERRQLASVTLTGPAIDYLADVRACRPQALADVGARA